jgi:Cu+-exporting ATPase
MAAADTHAGVTVKDPVCGMTVDPATAKGGSHEHAGTTYHFCSPGCRTKFASDPDGWLAKARAKAEAASTTDPHPAPAADAAPRPGKKTGAAVEYVCPMDPEVRQSGPGDCPKCGMALEPDVPAPAIRTEWTCPMHPEVVQDGPGSCPICGMALEPRTQTVEEPENEELRDMTRRFQVSVVLSALVMVVAMGEMLAPGLAGLASARTLGWVQLLLAAPV